MPHLIGSTIRSFPISSALWILEVPPLHFEVFFHSGKKGLCGYTDDSTLMVVVPSPGIRVAVAESLIRDLVRDSENI